MIETAGVRPGAAADPEDANSTAARLASARMPIDEAKAIGARCMTRR
jgi:hypothetical protein